MIIIKNDQFYKILMELLEHTKRKDYESIYKTLTSSSSDVFNLTQHKGYILEYYLAELFNGNGYHSFIRDVPQDSGDNLIIYNNKYSIVKCLQVINKSEPVSIAEIEMYSKKHKRGKFSNYPYGVISLSGFKTDKMSKNYKNIMLHDSSYIKDLIKNYLSKNNKNPGSSYFIEDINFVMNFDILIQFECNNNPKNYNKLSEDTLKWCTKMRMEKNKGILNLQYKKTLDRINFYWSDNERKWYCSYNNIKDVYLKYGTTFNKVSFVQKAWIKTQLRAYVDKKLSKDKIKKLKEIDIFKHWLLNTVF